MRIIDRYISRSIFLNLVGILTIFTLLFILVDSASNLDDYLDNQVSLAIVARYYLWFLPVMLQQTIAIAYLIAALLTYANLNTHNELIALRSGGLNFWRLAKPAAAFALLICALMFYVNEHYVPIAEANARAIKEDNFKADPARRRSRSLIKNLTFYGMQNRLYFIDSFDPDTNTLRGITVIGFDDEQNIKEKIVALEGTWTGVAWKFQQCNITPFKPGETGPSRILVYDEKLMDIKETPNDFLQQQQNVTYMNIRELRSHIKRFSNSGAVRAVDNLRVDLHAKIAYPFTTIIILLVGLPLVMVSGKRQAQTFTALGMAILIGFLYYVINAVGLAMGKGGILPPHISAWLAPAFFSLAASYLIWTKF